MSNHTTAAVPDIAAPRLVDVSVAVDVARTDACAPDRDDGGRDWHITFRFAAGPLAAEYIVEEPYLDSLATWRAIANGEQSMAIILYQGNGESRIEFERSSLTYTFIAAPSGSGGDVRCKVVVPAAAVSVALSAALGVAVERGYPFAS